MYIVVIAWLYVAFMMAVAEATSSTGTVLGAAITFLLYGALPLGLVMYVMSAPARGRAIKAREQAEWAAQHPPMSQPASEPASTESASIAASAIEPAIEPDTGSKASADTVTPVRKKA